jgi:hypothetical protein
MIESNCYSSYVFVKLHLNCSVCGGLLIVGSTGDPTVFLVPPCNTCKANAIRSHKRNHKL